MPRHTPHLLRSLVALLFVAATSPLMARDYSGHYSRPHSGYSHHGHYRSYPARGYSTYHLPHGYYRTRYHGAPYYYHGGSWYRPYGPRYVVVAPPIGIGISMLPPFYSTVWFGGAPYYYADDTYYTYRPERREYVVTAPPRGEVRADPSTGSDEVFVYPKEGQSDAQQATDRDECRQWAVARTGYDPTRPPGNVAETDMTSKRVNYARAEAACLEGRGYSVR